MTYIVVFQIPTVPSTEACAYQLYELEIPAHITARKKTREQGSKDVSEIEARKAYAASLFPRSASDIVLFVQKDSFGILTELLTEPANFMHG